MNFPFFIFMIPQKENLEKNLDKANDEIDRLLDIKESMLAANLDDEEEPTTNLYLKGFAPSTTERDLVDHFERYGRISSVKIFRKSKTHYGFIEFEESYEAERALDHRPHYVRGQKLLVAPAEHERAFGRHRSKPY
jgi:RNA recognition motif-containing protein